MFDNLSRGTLVRLSDESIFLIKCLVMEYHSGEEVPCYLGLRYFNGVDYHTSRCYTNQIESIIEEN
jgi:hypothetical protein